LFGEPSNKPSDIIKLDKAYFTHRCWGERRDNSFGLKDVIDGVDNIEDALRENKVLAEAILVNPHVKSGLGIVVADQLHDVASLQKQPHDLPVIINAVSSWFKDEDRTDDRQDFDSDEDVLVCISCLDEDMSLASKFNKVDTRTVAHALRKLQSVTVKFIIKAASKSLDDPSQRHTSIELTAFSQDNAGALKTLDKILTVESVLLEKYNYVTTQIAMDGECNENKAKKELDLMASTLLRLTRNKNLELIFDSFAIVSVFV
jgi:hypothetical protein